MRPRRRWIVPAASLAAATAAALIFRGPLVAWFSGGASSSSSSSVVVAPADARASAALADGSALPVVTPVDLPASTLGALRRALVAYDAARASLAADRVDSVSAPARALAAELRAAAAAPSTALPPPVASQVASAVAGADALAAATSIDDARRAFGDVSLALVTLSLADPRLQDGWHRYTCPMTPGFGEWLQRGDPLENPYMGAAMLSCGSTEPWAAVAGPDTEIDHRGHGHAGDDVSFYTCSMHTAVHQSQPGACPICGMSLVSVTFEQAESGTIIVEEARRGTLGVRTTAVTRAPLHVGIRAVGRVTYDETRLTDVTLKVNGWVTRLHVDSTGQAVKRGQILLTLFSPEVFAAQQEYLLALRATGAGVGDATVAPTGPAAALARAVATKLRLWGFSERQLDDLRRRGEPLEAVPVASPASGFVIEKDIVEGAAVEAGQRLFRIAALDRVWIEADVYGQDLARVAVGQAVRVTLPYLPGRELTGKVGFILPYLQAEARTGRVRIELPNHELALKPDMYANVEIELDLGARLQVPISAVVYTGPRRLVFVDLGGGRLRPVEVTLGARNALQVEIVSGVSEGQLVVSAGNFLVAAESRIRSAATLWEDDDGAR